MQDMNCGGCVVVVVVDDVVVAVDGFSMFFHQTYIEQRLCFTSQVLDNLLQFGLFPPKCSMGSVSF